jgi:hypothetical protein
MPTMSRATITPRPMSASRLFGAFISGALIATAGCGEGEGAAGRDLAVAADPAPVADTLVVYKTASCGCCKAWLEHMEQNGFTAVAHDEDFVTLNRRKGDAGVASELASCHTAFVGGYVVEGHVPADLVKRMLRDRPQIAGLAVPGMPVGSRGLEGAL